MGRETREPSDLTNPFSGDLTGSPPVMRRSPAKAHGPGQHRSTASDGDNVVDGGQQGGLSGIATHRDSVATLHFSVHGFMHCGQTRVKAECQPMETNILGRGDHQVSVGHRLRKLIDLLGMSYVEAAELMGVSKHVLRNWMAGESYPSPYPLYRLCRAKGVDFNYVFLADWASLPSRIAKPLEDELLSSLDGSAAPAPQGNGTP